MPPSWFLKDQEKAFVMQDSAHILTGSCYVFACHDLCLVCTYICRACEAKEREDDVTCLQGMEYSRRETEIIKNILWPVLAALRDLHRVGIVHRDVKPANLLVSIAYRCVSAGVVGNKSIGMLILPFLFECTFSHAGPCIRVGVYFWAC